MNDATHIFNIGAPIPEGPCAATSAIRDALAILDAIGQGGLFDAMPKNENDRHRHTTGVTLLELAESRLRQALGDEAHLASGDCCCGGRPHSGHR